MSKVVVLGQNERGFLTFKLGDKGRVVREVAPGCEQKILQANGEDVKEVFESPDGLCTGTFPSFMNPGG